MADRLTTNAPISLSHAPRWRWLLYAAVFFTFAPIWLLFISSFKDPPPIGGFLFLATLSGLIAVGYAFAGRQSSKILFWVIPIHISAIFLIPIFKPLGIRSAAPSLEGIASILFIAIGYILFIKYITGEGARTLRVRTEMGLARQIHLTLVPPIHLEGAHVEIVATSDASTEMGGDLVDLIMGEGHIDVAIADVTGHGVRAGVVMAMVKSAIRTRLASPGSLAEITADLNRVLHDLTPTELFVTFACLRIYPDATTDLVLAGHPPILHLRTGSDEIVEYVPDSMPLGIVPTEPYPARTITCRPGDILVALTDGLTEAVAASGKMLGLEPIRQALLRARDRPLRELHATILATVRNTTSQTDDQSLLIARFGAIPDSRVQQVQPQAPSRQ